MSEDKTETKKETKVPMFKYKGVEYPYFVANKTGNVGSPIVHPQSGKQIAILGADFMWQETTPFLDHLNLNLRDERNVREDESIRKRANLVAQNAKLFEALVQRGWIVKIDEFDEKTEPIQKDRTQMLAYQPEIQSQLMDDWLGNCHIERVFSDGEIDVDAMLSAPESIFFTMKIGNYKNPTHILEFEFNVPNPDARRSYENDTFAAGSKQDGDKMVSVYHVAHKAKLNFAKKYFKNVRGVMLAKEGDHAPELDTLKEIEEANTENVRLFKANFNPNWWIRLADALADCFNFGGK